MDKHKILVVDDDKDINNAIETILEMQNYEVMPAYCGEESLQKFEEVRPDLILLDLMLPDMTGTQVAKKIKAEHNGEDVPIVILSASRSIHDACKSIGAQDCIEKPFELKQLLTTVNKQLSH